MELPPQGSVELPANQIPIEMVPVSGSNPYFPYVSAARQVMYTGNRTQELSVVGRTRKRQRSALETELARATFRHEFDVDARVLAVIPRFKNDGLQEDFKINPLEIVIFENYETEELDCLELSKFHVMHQHYGFRFVENEELMEKLRYTRNPTFPAGTVLARSPNVTEDGDYMPGLETSVCLITDPAVTEDALVYSDLYADRIRTTGYETRTFGFGRTHYPTNSYGTIDNYLIVPNVGDKIHSNGLLCAMRPYDPILDAVYMSGKKLLKPVYGMDTPVYGVPNATVVDIKVIRNEAGRDRKLPPAMVKQLDRYFEADKRFYTEIIRTCLMRSGKYMTMRPLLSDTLNSLLFDAFCFVGADLNAEGLWPYENQTSALEVNRKYRGETLDEYRVELVYEFLADVKEGSKGTGMHGNKGVSGEVRPWQDMPIDENGNISELMALCTSITNRMNPGLVHEQMVGAAGRDVIKRIRRAFKLKDMGVIPMEDIQDVVFDEDNHEIAVAQFEYLLGFYKLVAPTENYRIMSTVQARESGRWLRHLAQVIKDGDEPYGIYFNLPATSPVRMDEVMRELKDGPYRPEITRVTYRDHSGKMVTSKEPILIGPNYYLILEKTATDWSGVSSSKTSHFGTTARLTNADKYSSPGRQTVTRSLDEASVRNMAAAAGGEILADIMDLNNNPTVHKEACTTIYLHPTPTNIERVVDRTKFKLGGHRPLAFAIHQLIVSGKNISHD